MSPVAKFGPWDLKCGKVVLGQTNRFDPRTGKPHKQRRN